MSQPPSPWITRRSLYQGRLFEVGAIVCKPTPDLRHEVEHAVANVLALPTAGVFALHPAPRRRLVATPSHAVFISSGQPYRVTFPGDVGDACLALRLTPEGLAALAPGAMWRDGFARATQLSRAVLPPGAILARGMLRQRLLHGEADPLWVEETGIALLASALGTVMPVPAARAGARHVDRAKEAIASQPQRRWTLAELAQVAGISACHLAHVFDREVGTSVYRYAIAARLARALDAVLDSSDDLTAIALDAGFASHSHFTARFRAYFGVTPRALRGSARAGEAARLRKIVTARRAVAA